MCKWASFASICECLWNPSHHLALHQFFDGTDQFSRTGCLWATGTARQPRCRLKEREEMEGIKKLTVNLQDTVNEELLGVACIQESYILRDLSSPLSWFGPRYSTCPNKDLVCVISLIKGLIGSQLGANHRLYSWENRGYEVGLGQGETVIGVLFKHTRHNWSKKYSIGRKVCLCYRA